MKWLLMMLGLLFAFGATAQQPPITTGGVTYNWCATEGGNCSFTGTKNVLFGTPSQFISKSFNGHADCYVSNNGFASDPAVGADKDCWAAAGSPPPVPPSVTLSASPSTITAGGSSTLSLATSNATSCTGPVAGTSGTATVSPSSTTSFTESCTGPGGTRSGSVTVTVNPVVPPTGGLTCTTTSVAGTGPSGVITADVVSADGTRVFPLATNFVATIDTNAPAQNLLWTIKDAKGATVASGTNATSAGSRQTRLTCNSSVAGYFAIGATLASNGGQVSKRGTRPQGIATFGVKPSLGGVIGAVAITPDQRRFGMQGFNSNYDALKVLGVTDVIDDGNQINLAPTCAAYTPSLAHLNPFFSAHPDVTRIVRLDGYPACNSVTGLPDDSYHLPANQSQWSAFVGAVAQETEMIRANTYPSQAKNYYQVTWEPSLAGTFLGGAGAADFATLYQLAFTAIHAKDPNAVVMGPGEPFADNNGFASGNRIASTPGLCSYLDGVTTHAYYNAPAVPSAPPELQDQQPGAEANSLPNEMKGLRAKMQACKPNMKLFNTEVGIPYDSGVSYAAVTANHLWAQAAVTARTHLIVLGEGAQRTYFFFGPDMPEGLSGYGTFFDLVQDPPQFGDATIAPKPVSMALAALTRVLDGTKTLGRVVGTASPVYAYSFQQLQGTQVITAAWAHSNAQWTGPNSFSQTYSQSLILDVDVPGSSGTVKLIDMMGNVSNGSYTNGRITLSVTEQPTYIVSNNPTVAAAHVTAPVGYTGQ